MNAQYRPSGPFRWMLANLPECKAWDLVGAQGTEERSRTVAKELTLTRGLRMAQLLDIQDEPSRVYSEAVQLAAESGRILEKLLGDKLSVYQQPLLTNQADLLQVTDQIVAALGSHVILDITSLPKRFFFFMLRRLCESTSIETLVATYAVPDRYARVLTVDAASWEPLPGFGPSSKHDGRPLLVIGVGYQHLKLIEVIDERKPSDVVLMLPFPSKPPGAIQNWEFVRKVDEAAGVTEESLIRVHTVSTPLAFDRLDARCSLHRGEVLLAPFGPKPLSLAMALYALSREKAGLPVVAGYTQPLAYNPRYSEGVERGIDGVPVVHSYLIKSRGCLLYYP